MDTIESINGEQMPRRNFAHARDESEHYENTPIQIYRKFHLKKPENFQIIYTDIFHISAQNIDCGTR